MPHSVEVLFLTHKTVFVQVKHLHPLLYLLIRVYLSRRKPKLLGLLFDLLLVDEEVLVHICVLKVTQGFEVLLRKLLF